MPHTQGFQCRKRIEKGEKRSILLIEGEIEKTTGRKAKQTKKSHGKERQAQRRVEYVERRRLRQAETNIHSHIRQHAEQ